MVNALVRIGQFIRVLDDSNNLSLTNAAVYITLYKLITVPACSYTDIAALIAALATYTAKKAMPQ